MNNLQNKKHRITISGLSGTGTSSIAKMLAKNFSTPFFGTGDFMREQAKERGMDIYKFDELCLNDLSGEIDLFSDNKMSEFCLQNENFVAEGRISWYFAKDAFKIKLDCSQSERLKRISVREGIDIYEAKEKTLKRELSFKRRAFNVYGIDDPMNDDNFDFVLDTTELSMEQVFSEIVKRL